jgi:hypothetical protein
MNTDETIAQASSDLRVRGTENHVTLEHQMGFAKVNLHCAVSRSQVDGQL